MRPLSSAELSRDISRLVSRALSGERIDTAIEGEDLAAKYPSLGMSGALIGTAIARAAGMMQTVLQGAEQVPPASADPALAGEAEGTWEQSGAHADEGTFNGDVTERGPDAILAEPRPDAELTANSAPESNDRMTGPFPRRTGSAKQRLAAVRRVFFRT